MSIHSLEACINRYITHLKKEKGYSTWTIGNNHIDLKSFLNWCHDGDYYKVYDINQEILLDYQLYLYHYQKANGDPLANLTQRQRISRLRLFFSWLNKNNYILYNPASELELAKKNSSLPRLVLSAYEADKIMSEVNVKNLSGIRDRAILECFYSTGIRRAELLNLKVDDVDFSRGTLMVRKGKGNKDRLIPIGERALKWLYKYLNKTRACWLNGANKEELFINHKGTPIQAAHVGSLVRNYIKKANIGKNGSCHLFRHSMATLMLDNGASVRHVQQMLGHASIDTTQEYTHISIAKLKEVHKQSYHYAYVFREEEETIDESMCSNIDQYLDDYLSFIKEQKDYADTTIDKIRGLIKLFLDRNKLEGIKQLEPEHYFAYENYVYTLKNKDGHTLDSVTKYNRLCFVRDFLEYLFNHNYIDFTIQTKLEKPYYGKRAINLLTIDEIEAMINVINIDDYVGLRDRAMFELTFSSAVRRNDLINLKLNDVDLETGTIMIKAGLNIPITERALYWLKEYLSNSRALFVKKDSDYVFLSQKSAQCSIDTIIDRFNKYAKMAGVNKEVSCHVFRSSWEAFMLDNGANHEFIHVLEGRQKTLSLTELRSMLVNHHPAKEHIAVVKKRGNKTPFNRYLDDYLQWMAMQNSSKKTIANRKSYVNKFINWCFDRGLDDPKDVDKQSLKRYQRYVYDLGNEHTGEPLSVASRRYMLSHVISFYSYLVKMKKVLYNPGADLDLAKIPCSLPANVLTEAEAEAILSQPDINTLSGLRDRAILECFYATGLRRKEVSNLKIEDIDFNEKSLMVRGGKGLKDRLIPLGDRALQWINRYMRQARPEFLKDTSSDYIFLSAWGIKLNEKSVGAIVKSNVVKSGIKKQGSSLLFRHTMATLMLDNGADIRYIQQMLGHKRLATTEVYTHVSIGKLKEVHDKTHPARLKPRE